MEMKQNNYGNDGVSKKKNKKGELAKKKNPHKFLSSFLLNFN